MKKNKNLYIVIICLLSLISLDYFGINDKIVYIDHKVLLNGALFTTMIVQLKLYIDSLIHGQHINFKYCQSEIEDDAKCNEQCEHCSEYYKTLENEEKQN